MFGRATVSSIQDLLRYAPPPARLPRGLRREQLSLKPWICQRCYHYSQRTLYLERTHTTRRDNYRKIPPRIGLSRSPSQTLSTHGSNAADRPRNDLPSQEEGRRSHISKRFSYVMDHLQSNIFIAGQRLNDLTGYSGIEALKKDIEQQG